MVECCDKSGYKIKKLLTLSGTKTATSKLHVVW